MMQTTKMRFDKEELNKLNVLLAARIEELLQVLNIGAAQGYNRYTSNCPIHLNSDNPTAFSISIIDKFAFWKCYSHSCNEVFKSSLLGLIRAKISRDKYGWRGNGDAIAPFGETLRWAKNFLGIENNDIDVKFNAITHKVVIQKPIHNELYGYPRDKVRAKLKIPCPYMERRGIDKRVLERYDVGTCLDPMTKFHNRTICPIYDETHKALIGISGRSIFDKCNHCKLHHNPAHNCPNKPEFFSVYAKWRHSKGLMTSHNLYNFWDEFDYIECKRSVIIVESIVNCLKLVQNGARNVVCTFGTKFTADQNLLLCRAKVNKVLVMFDNDSAGRAASEKVCREYENFYNIKSIFPCPENQDLGDMNDSYIKNNVFPAIRKVAK